MLQAWRRSGFRVRLSLSGVTPGERVGLRFRRVRERCAKAQKSSRRVGLVGVFPAFDHAEPGLFDGACQGIPLGRSCRRGGHCARFSDSGRIASLARASRPPIRQDISTREDPAPASRCRRVPAPRPRLPSPQARDRNVLDRSAANAARRRRAIVADSAC